MVGTAGRSALPKMLYSYTFGELYSDLISNISLPIPLGQLYQPQTS